QRFHRLIERFLLGLSITPWLEGDRELAACFATLQEAFPGLMAEPAGETAPLCEHRRSLQVGPYLLTAIYDLLILEADHALIIDWKTAARPRDRSDLKNDWQTQLYLYLLSETSPKPAEQLRMTYWFVRAVSPSDGEGSQSPAVITFDYDPQWHQAIQDRLTQCLDQLTHWRQDWLQWGTPFPQVAPHSKHCHHCAFAQPCDRAGANPAEPTLGAPAAIALPPWEKIPEINPNNL
ncbi:MAG: PD-(D/E)XK nuclease family protein, partial [Cyanobacteria bacterium P01_H01_bin.130]